MVVSGCLVNLSGNRSLCTQQAYLQTQAGVGVTDLVALVFN
jgi:hypothetical protein